MPTVTRHPRNKTTEVSERVVLTCRFLNVQHFDWLRDGKKIPLTRDMSDYVINEMSPPDQGYYSCVGIQDGRPDIESNRALLRIRGNLFCLRGVVLVSGHLSLDSPPQTTTINN